MPAGNVGHAGARSPALSASSVAVVLAVREAGVQGDNNWGDDRALYNEGQQWLNLNHLMGRVVG